MRFLGERKDSLPILRLRELFSFADVSYLALKQTLGEEEEGEARGAQDLPAVKEPERSENSESGDELQSTVEIYAQELRSMLRS